MKQKIVLVAMTLALTFSAGSGLANAQTTTGTTIINASATTNGTSYWQEFLGWLGSFAGTSNAAPPDDGNCPLRICTSDPDHG